MQGQHDLVSGKPVADDGNQHGEMQAGYRAVLLIEPDVRFAKVMRDNLTAFGTKVVHVQSLDMALTISRAWTMDAILLGRVASTRDQIDAVSRVRQAYCGAIVVMTEDPDVNGVIALFDAGADNVVDKRDGVHDIIARMRAVIRRMGTSHSGQDTHVRPSQGSEPQNENDKPWRLRHSRQIVTPSGQVLTLTRAERDLLTYFARHRGRLVTRAELFMAYRGTDQIPKDSRALDQMISRLRILLRPHIVSRSFIKAISYRGYVFTGFSLEERGADIPSVRPNPDATAARISHPLPTFDSAHHSDRWEQEDPPLVGQAGCVAPFAGEGA